MTVIDNGVDLAALAATDRRVAKDLSAAERERQARVQRIAEQDAATSRRLREADGRLDLEGKRDEVKAARRERRIAAREAKRAAKRSRKAAWWAAQQARGAAAVEYVRNNAAATYSSVIYGLAVSGAVYGQIDAAQHHRFPMLLAVSAAIAIEGTGLAMALTAQGQRLLRERAIAARTLVWLCTAGAVGINYGGHVDVDPAKAYILSALSALGIIVFEIRSGAKHRAKLRELGMIPEPGERFGLARWLTCPRETFAAWKLGVRDRVSPGAATLITRVEQARVRRRQLDELRTADRRRQALVADVAKQARKAARAATREGDAGAALAALVRLAHTGTPAPLLALPSTAHVEARTARAEAEAARRARAEAEAVVADAIARAEAEAAARAEAEARAAAAGAEAEAARTAAAEAEARADDAGRKLRAEAFRREEAEAHAAASAERAARAEGAAHVSEQAATVARQKLAAEQERRAQAAAQAEATQQLLADEQHRRAQAESQAQRVGEHLADAREQRRQAAAEVARLTPLAEQAAVLREQIEALQAGKPRTRRAPATTAEPVLFEGRPVPAVDGVSAATVAAVLTARKASPAATQKELAATVGTTDRTVRTVIAAVTAEQQEAAR